ncbi:hypothetical protein IKG13_00365 [Candidatus Saccharibacteria bacterium]|nr:hypothetical protein [Candidatus Saccharibacteria bacterium]MBR3378307.1 hypothetical protein [Candidatus Saccharibacteria bacterium]
MKTGMKRVLIGSAVALFFGGAVGASAYTSYTTEQQQWARQCDGIKVTEKCTGEDNERYTKYIFHEAVPEKKETIHHDRVPAVTHTVHHPEVYGTRRVATCVKTTISYKHGTCALSQCWDGEYSGSAGWGTCNYHGGVMRSGGPWYVYHDETYLISAAWDEVVVDVPEKPAYDEERIVVEAKEAYYEKIKA